MTINEVGTIIDGVKRYMEICDGGIIENISYIGAEDKGIYFDMVGQCEERFKWVARLEDSDKPGRLWKFIIENERGENLLNYAEEMELSKEDCDYITYAI